MFSSLRSLFNIPFFLFHHDRRFYFNLIRILGFLPGKINLYHLAFVHKSASYQRANGDHINNERLEYLGDAVLDTIVADYLFKHYPSRDEGFMTKMRANIVKRKNLNFLAKKMGIPGLIISHTYPGNKAKNLYGNALEALIGAIYLDKGYRRTRRFFIRKIIQKHIDLIQLVRKDSDYKSQIIEYAQKEKMEVVFETKEEHSTSAVIPAFVSNVLLNGEISGTGRGGSKKEAEQQAAKVAQSLIHSSIKS